MDRDPPRDRYYSVGWTDDDHHTREHAQRVKRRIRRARQSHTPPDSHAGHHVASSHGPVEFTDPYAEDDDEDDIGSESTSMNHTTRRTHAPAAQSHHSHSHHSHSAHAPRRHTHSRDTRLSSGTLHRDAAPEEKDQIMMSRRARRTAPAQTAHGSTPRSSRRSGFYDSTDVPTPRHARTSELGGEHGMTPKTRRSRRPVLDDDDDDDAGDPVRRRSRRADLGGDTDAPLRPRRSRRSDASRNAAAVAPHAHRHQSRPSHGPRRKSMPRQEPTNRAFVSSSRTANLLEGSGRSAMDARSIETSGSTVFHDTIENHDVMMAAREPPRTNKTRHLAVPPRNQVNTMKEGRVFAMNGIDNLTLLMEDDTYQPACFSIYLFKTRLDYKTVRAFFEVLVQLYPKYRYVVDFEPYSAHRRDKRRRKQTAEDAERVHRERNEAMKRGNLPPNRGPRMMYSKTLRAGSWLRPAQWRIDEDFHVSENIEVISCEGHGTDEQLFKVAGRFLARHFDYNKPVWEALLVQGLNTADGGKSALMIKIHHCFSDGQGMIQSYHAALTAMSKGMGIKEVQQWVDTSKQKKKSQRKALKPSVFGTISHTCYTIRELYMRRRRSFVYRNMKMKRTPQRLYFHSDGISMDAIKRIREAYSTEAMNLTLNDVAIAILARAMAQASRRLSPVGTSSDNRAAIFIPISVRPQGNWDLHNFTTGAMIWLKYPNLDETPVENMLADVHKEMMRLKKSHLPKIWYKLFLYWCRHRVGFLPNYPVTRQLFYRAFSEYHVATNVPGPTEPVKFGRHEAYSYHVLPPSSPGKATMAIGMISYAKDFSLAVSCDDVPEFRDVPHVLCKAFEEAAKVLIQAADHRLANRKESTS